MDWKECELKRLAKKVTVDKSLIDSLKKSSRNKLESSNRLALDEVTSASVISLTYEALRELLEAVALSNGYKIYNHECITPFLKEIMKKEDLSISFDKFRQIRNRINYYGKKISLDDAKSLKKEIVELIGKIKSM